MRDGGLGAFLGLAAAAFGLVAVLHAVRIVDGWAFRFGPWQVPVWVSVADVVVSGGLALWALLLLVRRQRRS